MKKLTILAAAMSFGTTFAAYAAPLQDMTDTDGNGSISMDEAKATNPEITAEEFTAVDTDGSGELSVEEIEAAKGS